MSGPVISVSRPSGNGRHETVIRWLGDGVPAASEEAETEVTERG